jgi:hypothetical protein
MFCRVDANVHCAPGALLAVLPLQRTAYSQADKSTCRLNAASCRSVGCTHIQQFVAATLLLAPPVQLATRRHLAEAEAQRAAPREKGGTG